MRKVLFWDFHGTLIHGDPEDDLWTDALWRALAAQGYSLPREALREPLHGAFSWYRPQDAYPERVGACWWEDFFGRLEGLYRDQGIPQTAWDKINALLKREGINPAYYTPFADAAGALRDCAALGWENYLLSNNFPELAEIARAIGLGEWLRGSVLSANIGYEKPRRELFAAALRLAGGPARCYMIGDNPVSDIQGAKTAGLGTILVHREADCGADHCCRTLAEIPARLQ